MLGFLRGDADCLVTTTIIESGLDIPTANTLIVERADQLGLAQAYQIRGRVGRSRERAFAYLLYPSAEALTEEAAARLSTLADHTELGSGFKIAMRDLDIRGAGDLLGDEQSGHVAAVGFELYCQMIDEAVGRGARGRRGGGGAGAGAARRRRSTPTCPPPSSPSRRPRSTSTAASRPPASPASCGRSATSSTTASGRRRPRPRTCWRCSGRGSSSASPGRAASSSAAGGSASPGSSSTPSGAAVLPRRSRGRSTSGARRPPSVRVPDEPEARLAAVLAMAAGYPRGQTLPGAGNRDDASRLVRHRSQEPRRAAFDLCCALGGVESAAEEAAGQKRLALLGLRRPFWSSSSPASRSPRASATPASPPARSRWSRTPPTTSARSPTRNVRPRRSSRLRRNADHARVPKPGDEQYDGLKETALGELLDSIWIQGAAAEMGIPVTPQEVDAELKKLKEQSFQTEKQYQEFLKESRYTDEDVDRRVKLQILSTKIQDQVQEEAPTPSSSEIEDFYEAAKASQFTTPESRDVRIVVNKDERKSKKRRPRSKRTTRSRAGKRSRRSTRRTRDEKQRRAADGPLRRRRGRNRLNAEVFARRAGRARGAAEGTRAASSSSKW